MSFDLVTWAPRVGSSGDNLYNVPGATKLDGTLDTGAPCSVQAADVSGFSATPTIAQLNASSGFNQVAGAYNRRALTYNSRFGTALVSASYVAVGNQPAAADFTGLLSKINTMRAAEGWAGGSLAWPISTPTAGGIIRGHHLAFLRKALAISGTFNMTPWASNSAVDQRTDSPTYGTKTAESIISSTNSQVGQIFNSGLGTYTRDRSIINFQCPEWLAFPVGASSAVLNFQNGSPNNNTNAGWTIDTYITNVLLTSPAIADFSLASGNWTYQDSSASTGTGARTALLGTSFTRGVTYLALMQASSNDTSNTSPGAGENFVFPTAYALTLTF